MSTLNCPICGACSLKIPSQLGGKWFVQCAECFSGVEVEPGSQAGASPSFRVKGGEQRTSLRDADLYRRRTSF